MTKPSKLVGLDRCVSCPHAGAFSTALFPICAPPVVDNNRVLPCVHRGDVLHVVECELCGSIGKQVNVHSCAVHKECTPNAWTTKPKRPAVCVACPQRVDPLEAKIGPMAGPIGLAWYVWPRRDTRDVWEWQQSLIRAAIDKFDGPKRCVIARSDDAIINELDLELFDDSRIIDNDPNQREVPGWRWLLEQSQHEPGATVWLHAKGVYRGLAEQHLKRWVELAYENMLNVDAVRASLQTALITGCFRRNQAATNLGVPWHYSGSFYAVRNSAIHFPPTIAGGWYAEAWPALIAPRELAACLKFDGVGDLYQSRSWREMPCA